MPVSDSDLLQFLARAAPEEASLAFAKMFIYSAAELPVPGTQSVKLCRDTGIGKVTSSLFIHLYSTKDTQQKDQKM